MPDKFCGVLEVGDKLHDLGPGPLLLNCGWEASRVSLLYVWFLHPNCVLKMFWGKKIPESSKNQNLNLSCTGNYLHRIDIILYIILNLEMI